MYPVSNKTEYRQLQTTTVMYVSHNSISGLDSIGPCLFVKAHYLGRFYRVPSWSGTPGTRSGPWGDRFGSILGNFQSAPKHPKNDPPARPIYLHFGDLAENRLKEDLSGKSRTAPNNGQMGIQAPKSLEKWSKNGIHFFSTIFEHFSHFEIFVNFCQNCVKIRFFDENVAV